jgi:hypothetical protein
LGGEDGRTVYDMVGKNDVLGRRIEGVVSFGVLGDCGVNGCEDCDALNRPVKL